MDTKSHLSTEIVLIKERIEIILLWEQIGAINRSVAESFNSTHEGMNISHTTVGRLLTQSTKKGAVFMTEREMFALQ